VGSRPWTDWHAVWGTESRPRRNHPCQILCQSVKVFLGGNTPKCAISYTFLNDPYNSSALPCRLWCCYITNVLNGAESLPKISIGWVGCTNVTDRRQTTDDRQTDRRRHIANMNMSSRSLKTCSVYLAAQCVSSMEQIVSPLHISGTVRARNVKFGRQIDRRGH